MDFLYQLPKTQVIQSPFEKESYVFLDLSVNNEELAKIDVSNTNAFQNYLINIIEKNPSKCAQFKSILTLENIDKYKYLGTEFGFFDD